MSSTQIDPLLRFIRQLAVGRKDSELPDHQLLERFATLRDEAAFAAILRRHGPMVLSVCRSVLHNVHDAEDAFQAAFLVLARKAGSIQRRESVSSWLYRVAYHLAVKAQANAARRKNHEKRAAVMPSAEPVMDMSLRELQGILHEEIERLPEQYRAPVVLCGLEEKSLEEAAHLLGWSKGCVKGRLQRAREQLRLRLRRRGVALSIGLLSAALATNSVTAQVPARLITSTLRTALQIAAGGELAAGAVSANVAALIQGARPTMFFGKVKIAIIFVLAIGISASGLSVLAYRELAADSADPPSKETTKGAGPRRVETATPVNKTGRDSISVRGRVFGPDGKPFARAKLYFHPSASAKKSPRMIATSGEDGRFEFALERTESERTTARFSAPDHPTKQIVAVAEGYGCDWAGVDPTAPEGELVLRLVKDVPIRGRILDQEGRPVRGAKVRVLDLTAYPGEDLTKMLEEIRQKGWSSPEGKYWDGLLPGQSEVLTVDGDGRFRMAGFGRERQVRLLIEGPGIQHGWITVMTRIGEAVAGPPPTIEGVRAAKVYAASFDYPAAPSRPIRGVVRDKISGRPVAGVTIEAYRHTTHQTQTDQEGRYELLGSGKSSTYTLIAKPFGGLHFAIQARFPDTIGFGPLHADLELPAGIPVRGRVVEKATGKPVAGVRVSYHVLFPNPKAGRLSDFLEHDPLSWATTGADGSFAVAALPGPGVIAAAAPQLSAYGSAMITPKELEEFFKGPLDPYNSEHSLMIAATGMVEGKRPLPQSRYHSLALINPTEKDEGLTRNLELPSERTRGGKVIGLDGEPLSGVTVYGLELDRNGSLTLNSADFKVRALHPLRRTRQLVFHHKAKNLGRLLEIRETEDGLLSVQLQPCGSASGRIVDQTGKPLSGLSICFCQAINNLSDSPFFPAGGKVTTNRDGRFRAEGLVPGVKYHLTRPLVLDKRLAELTVESGKTKELGDLTIDVPN